MIKHFKPMPVYVPPKGTEGVEQYRRLVALAYADLSRRGFTDGAVEAFLDKRCGVPFSIILELPETPFAPYGNDQELWAHVLEYAKASRQ